MYYDTYSCFVVNTFKGLLVKTEPTIFTFDTYFTSNLTYTIILHLCDKQNAI